MNYSERKMQSKFTYEEVGGWDVHCNSKMEDCPYQRNYSYIPCNFRCYFCKNYYCDRCLIACVKCKAQTSCIKCNDAKTYKCKICCASRCKLCKQLIIKD